MAGTSRATVNRVLARRRSAARSRSRAGARPCSIASELSSRRCRARPSAKDRRAARRAAGRSAACSRSAPSRRGVRADDLGADRDHLDARAASGRGPRTRGRRGRPRAPGSTPNSRANVACRGREEPRVESRLPWRIRAAHLDARPRRAERARCIVARTSSSAAAFELRVIDPSVSVAVFGRRDREARARLDDSGQRRAHRDDAGRDRRDQVEHASRRRASARRELVSATRARSSSASPSSVPAYCARDRCELCLRCGAERLLRVRPERPRRRWHRAGSRFGSRRRRTPTSRNGACLERRARGRGRAP